LNFTSHPQPRDDLFVKQFQSRGEVGEFTGTFGLRFIFTGDRGEVRAVKSRIARGIGQLRQIFFAGRFPNFLVLSERNLFRPITNDLLRRPKPEPFQKFCSCSRALLIFKCPPSPHPGPLPRGEGESSAAVLEKPASGFARQPLEKPENFASCSLSPRERVRVRGKECPLFRWLQLKLNRPMLPHSQYLDPACRTELLNTGTTNGALVPLFWRNWFSPRPSHPRKRESDSFGAAATRRSSQKRGNK
jgi:hypothetical protein